MLSFRISPIFSNRKVYRGDVVDVRSPDQPNPNYPILIINLLDWRMNVAANIECDFGASLLAQNTTRQLGMFNGMAMRWMEGLDRALS